MTVYFILQAKCEELHNENERLGEKVKNWRHRKLISGKNSWRRCCRMSITLIISLISLSLLYFLTSSSHYSMVAFWKEWGRSGSKLWQEKEQQKPAYERKPSMSDKFVMITCICGQCGNLIQYLNLFSSTDS